MIKTKLDKLEYEVGEIKRKLLDIRKSVNTMRQPIIIEQLTKEKLSERERKLMDEALQDLKKGRKRKFVTLDEFRKKIATK